MQLISHLEANSLLPKELSEFRKFHSTQDPVDYLQQIDDQKNSDGTILCQSRNTDTFMNVAYAPEDKDCRRWWTKGGT